MTTPSHALSQTDFQDDKILKKNIETYATARAQIPLQTQGLERTYSPIISSHSGGITDPIIFESQCTFDILHDEAWVWLILYK